ncbi:MAG: hypothetical protein HY021_02510 [Burkholderiales bacterium]|nr:hypothetical protein [Burkholderiales bacterium]
MTADPPELAPDTPSTVDAAAHEGRIEIGAFANIDAPSEIGLLHAEFVRYPGCQQLTVWLPQPGHTGYGRLCVRHGMGLVLEQAEVARRLNGSVQLLWDTLPWPPGALRITIEHSAGWQHLLLLQKLAAEAPPPPQVPHPPPAPIPFSPPRAVQLSDVERALRQQADRLIAGRLGRHLDYDGNYRAGTITYVEGDLRIALWHEMGGGACKFYIDLPTAAQWEARTGTALARRDEIVAYVAATVQRERAGSWRYEISDDTISFY